MLKIYKEYINNYDIAMTTYDRCIKHTPFKMFLEVSEKKNEQ